MSVLLATQEASWLETNPRKIVLETLAKKTFTKKMGLVQWALSLNPSTTKQQQKKTFGHR
jgi:hypothetical protein